MKRLAIIMLAILAMGYTQDSKSKYVAEHIENLREGVLLVRLHEHLGVQKKMLQLKQYRTLEAKKKEIAKKNEGMIKAFNNHYSFSSVYFFYARNTKKIIAKEYNGNVFDSSLVNIDTSFLAEKSVYILDGEHVYFESFGQDSEGYAIYNDSLKLLEKPFPFYVRKQSGTLIVKRTEPEMVIKLQDVLDKVYQKYVIQEEED